MNDVDGTAIDNLFRKYCDHIFSINLQILKESPQVVELQPVSLSEFSTIWSQLSQSRQKYWKSRFESYDEMAAESERLRIVAALTSRESSQTVANNKRAA